VSGLIAGAEGDGPADAVGGLAVVPLLVGDDAEQVQGVGVVGSGAEDVAVQPGGPVEAAAAVLLQANGKVVAHEISSPRALVCGTMGGRQPGAQTGRPGAVGPVRRLLGGAASPDYRFLQGEHGWRKPAMNKGNGVSRQT
jgi:hypothetical protein